MTAPLTHAKSIYILIMCAKAASHLPSSSAPDDGVEMRPTNELLYSERQRLTMLRSHLPPLYSLMALDTRPVFHHLVIKLKKKNFHNKIHNFYSSNFINNKYFFFYFFIILCYFFGWFQLIINSFIGEVII